MAKRTNSSGTSSSDSQKKSKTFVNEYDGYSPAPNDTVPIEDINKITEDEFYSQYIQPRKPVIIEGSLPGFPTKELQLPDIEETLNSDDGLLLVERINQGGFGSSQKRIKMNFKEFMKKLKEDGNEYYLTTQYVEDDPDRDLNVGSSDEEEEEEEEGDLFGAPDGASFTPPGSPEGRSDEENDGEKPILEGEFSDADSIDFNDIHDDFDELEVDAEDLDRSEDEIAGPMEEEEDDNDTIDKSLPGDPLTIEEATTRFEELIQKPLSNAYLNNNLPLKPTLFTKLTTQQINIWIGSTKSKDGKTPSLDLSNIEIDQSKQDLGLGRKMVGEGISSGLHHDHADNLYVPLMGHKRFTIFSPKDTSNLYTVGNVNKVYPSGIIDYKNDSQAPFWRELRGDSAIKTEVNKWKLDNEDLELREEERNQLIDEVESEEDLLEENEAKFKNCMLDPPSFSKIPASLLHLEDIPESSKSTKEQLQSALESKYPKLMNCDRLTVDLKPGQLFFLPAGWFHEVTSFGDDQDDNHIHIALNYWFAPPDVKHPSTKKVYNDEYWVQDFERTLKSCEYLKNKLNSIGVE
ncbi:hypothetical protein WICPIJ_008769 [Wickerhamomyces pijperi]|uniref:JmjC domain-containing protein n=1 Tax=Wickerhamomyces pijperi TaxID=599730 RepID=A0A9P8PV84_WICPI|nr:hypothetical protein WICPIJ_008769 [Wickerhamomyces pijperi]